MWVDRLLAATDACKVDTGRRGLVDLVVPDLRHFVPPAWIFDKLTYSPWIDGRLHRALFLRFKEAVPSGNQTLANSNPVLAETGMEMVRWTPSGPKT